MGYIVSVMPSRCIRILCAIAGATADRRWSHCWRRWADQRIRPDVELVRGERAYAVFAARQLSRLRAGGDAQGLDNVVIVGATRAAAQIISRNVRERELNILGYFDDRTVRTAATMMGDAPPWRVDDLLAGTACRTSTGSS
jgi:hypothetical protein